VNDRDVAALRESGRSPQSITRLIVSLGFAMKRATLSNA
jgi:alkylhydroperoxidase family enzyme